MSFGSDDSASGGGDPADPWGEDVFDGGRPMSSGWVHGVGVVAIAVVIGALLVPSATRPPLAATTVSHTGSGGSGSGATGTRGAGTSTSVPRTTTTTGGVLPGASAIRVLVANGTSVSHLAEGTATYLHGRGFVTLTPTNSTLKVTATQVYAASGQQVAATLVVNALGLPTGAVQPSSAVAPVANTGGATVVVIIGPDLSRRAHCLQHGHAGLTGPAPVDDGEDRPVLPASLRALASDPAAGAVCSDFDGTLAPIVARPEDAVPLPGVTEVLAALAARYRVVAVVSGRPVTFLMDRLAAAGPGVRLFGVHGFEWAEGDVVRRHPEVEAWREPAGRVAAAAHAAFGGTSVGVEDKAATVAVHWRQAPEAGPEVLAFARRWEADTGLVVQRGRQIVEFRPPVAVDKGSVVAELAQGCAAACFFGDDTGDLAAFAALERLGAAGTAVARVAVADVESPPELLAAADVVVPGPAEALSLLRALAGAPGDE